MAGLRVGILALQGDVAEHAAAFEACGARTVAVRRSDDLSAVDALALPGGETTAMSRLLRVSGLDEPLRERIAAGLPCFATCAGLILLSRDVLDGRSDQLAYGGFDIAVRRNGYGRQVASFEADVEVDGLDLPFPAIFIRAPVVETVGEEAAVVARLDGRPVGVEQGASAGYAFHPEISGDLRLHRRFLDAIGR